MLTPRIASIISKQVGYIVLFLTAVFYVVQLVNESSSNVLTVGLAAFGIIGALSAICFTLVPCLDKDDEKIETLYAGTKFLHSSLLIIQSIFIKYASEQILSLQLIKNFSWMVTIITIITNVLILTVASYATYFSLYGFQALNDFLWNRYEKRMEKVTSKNK